MFLIFAVNPFCKSQLPFLDPFHLSILKMILERKKKEQSVIINLIIIIISIIISVVERAATNKSIYGMM